MIMTKPHLLLGILILSAFVTSCSGGAPMQSSASVSPSATNASGSPAPVSSASPAGTEPKASASPSSPVPTPDPSIPDTAIEGIGEFKINMTFEEFSKKYPNLPKVARYSSSYYSHSADAVEVTPEETPSLGIISGNYCSDAREFEIKDYKVADLTLDLDLRFYKGRLAYINTDRASILSAITSKYGEGKLTSTSKEIECVNKLTGLSFTETESSYYTRWRNSSKNISIVSNLWNSYDSKCSKSTYFYFSVTDENTQSAYSACNTLAQDAIKKQQSEQEKDRLKDL